MCKKGLQSKVVYACKEELDTLRRMISLRRIKIVPNRIFFSTYQEAYTCNCKYIAEKILEKKLNYELVFSVSRDVCEHRKEYGIPDEIHLVERYSRESFRLQASSKIWIDNRLNCIWKKVPKRSEQIYLNTWHGSLGIKRLSGSMHWKSVARYGNHKIDYFLTDSKFDEQVFSQSFWPDVKQLKIGHPRNDILFHRQQWPEIHNKVYQWYGIDSHIKTLLYAPTFRDDGNVEGLLHTFDFHGILQSCQARFGGTWMMLTRCHYHDMEKLAFHDGGEDQSCVMDVSDYPDMQELMAAVDLGITDYSSWIFDFIFTEKPAFLYAEDANNYINQRGFYYPLSESPFSIAEKTDQLCRHIEQFDLQAYIQRCQRFLETRGCYETGDACERIIDFIQHETMK